MGACPLAARVLHASENRRCPALERHDDGRGFVCGLVRDPGCYVPLYDFEARTLSDQFAQAIAVGAGCDATYDTGLVLTE